MSQQDLDSYLESVLKERQREVILQVMTGRTNLQVGQQLGIAEKTVKYHITNIYKLMKVKNRGEAMIKLHNFKIN